MSFAKSVVGESHLGSDSGEESTLGENRCKLTELHYYKQDVAL